MIDVDALHEAEQQALDHLAQMDLALAARPRAITLICDDLQESLASYGDSAFNFFAVTTVLERPTRVECAHRDPSTEIPAPSTHGA